MNSIGIPREAKIREKRVGLTPRGTALLAREGFRVFVQAGAGSGSGFSDKQYCDAGAEMLPDRASVYAHASVIQKVKEPQAVEYNLIRHDHTLFGFLHLASPESCDLIRALMRSGCTAVGYETVETSEGRPLLTPMSRLAGALSVLYAAYLQGCFSEYGGNREAREQLAAANQFYDGLEAVADAYPNIDPGLLCGPVLVYGGGIAGSEAIRTALALGSSVTVVEISEHRRRLLEEIYGAGLLALSPDDARLEDALVHADVLVGAVHARGCRAEKVMDEELLARISGARPKLIMDIAIDQGGNFPEARPTTYEKPLAIDSAGNLRFSVPNIPSLAGRAATEALEEAALPYTFALMHGLKTAFQEKPELREAVNISGGEVMLQSVKEAHQL